MKKTLFASLTLAVALASGLAVAEPATTVVVPDHARVNEIDQRLENQQERINEGVAKGQINAKQAAHDEAVDTRVANQLSADQTKHNGHITKGEERRMNRELNHNGKRIHHQRTHQPAATLTQP
jgi:hypothetical protein